MQASPKEIWRLMSHEERVILSAFLETWTAGIETAIKNDIKDDTTQYEALQIMMQRWVDATPVLQDEVSMQTIGQYVVAQAKTREIAQFFLQNRPNSPELNKSEE